MEDPMGFPDWLLAPLLRPGERPPGSRLVSRRPAPAQPARTSHRRTFGLRPAFVPPTPRRLLRRS